jgi:hypothetical protein
MLESAELQSMIWTVPKDENLTDIFGKEPYYVRKKKLRLCLELLSPSKSLTLDTDRSYLNIEGLIKEIRKIIILE